MKMKWKNVLSAFILGIGITLSMSSCSDDNGGTDPGVDPPVEEGDFYLPFDMSMASKLLMTKATEDGDLAEQAVRDGFMVLYDPTSMQAKYKFDLNVNNGDGGSAFNGTDVVTPSTSSSGFRTVAQKINKQNYKLLVVLNPTTAMKTATGANKYYAEFETAKTEAASGMKDGTTGDAYKYIPMTNASGLVDVLEDTHLYLKKETAEAATIVPQVQVDRILAKVFFKLSDNLQVANSGEFLDATWQLDITNKKTFWVRRLTYVAPATDNGGISHTIANAGSTTWKPESQFTTLFREYVYSEDPNWSNISQDRINGNRDLLAPEFNYLAAGATPPAFSQTLTKIAGDGSREYVLENTMEPEDQWEDVTTRALVRANYKPQGFGAGADYYYYGGAAFTFAKIKEMYDDIVNDNKNYPWPDAPSGMKEVIEQAKSEGFFGAGSSIADRTESGDAVGGQLAFYKGGISYYAVKIRHFDDELSSNEPEVSTNPDFMNFGRWGIVRNNVYKMTLNNVSGPGKPSIPDPEGPDDDKFYWLSVDVKVLPWVVREQPVDI